MTEFPLRFVARLTLELTTPLLIGGDTGEFTDHLFVRDSNGLPTIPGTSLCGLLRHAALPYMGEEKIEKMFGFQKGDKGQGSRLSFSFGIVHNQQNQPVEGLLSPLDLCDPVLANAVAGVYRDHVCIGHHGAVDGNGKFDQTAVTSGHRFTFELELSGNKDDRKDWDLILELLTSRTLRLGGSTRRGFGGFKIISARKREFDLSDSEDYKTFCNHPILLKDSDDLNVPIKVSEQFNGQDISLALEPEGFWMFGGGDFDQDGFCLADMLPVSERRICWNDGNGSIGSEEILIPASSVKGALAHRCAFYARALTGQYADGRDADEINKIGSEKPEILIELFGDAKDDNGIQGGSSGRVFIDDIYLNPSGYTQKHVDHVSIDRFTGGPIDGALFSEKPFYKSPATIPLAIHVDSPETLSGGACKAFRLALNDLSRGELPLGGGVNRGNGVFVAGKVEFPQWLQEVSHDG